MDNNKIAQLRNAKGLSQSQLAGMMDVGKQSIANWENGRRDPSISNLYELSKIFDTTIDYIMGNTSKSGREWYVNMDCVNDECMDGNYICQGVPEAVVIAKALRRMNLEQRNRLLDICNAAFPEEFYDLVHHKWDDEEQEEVTPCQEQPPEPPKGAEPSGSGPTDAGKPDTP